VIDVRAAQAVDLDAMTAIEAACFPASPWPRETFADEIVRPVAHTLVATHGDVVAAFACTWHVGDEAHLLRIAVAPQRQRTGIGRRLLDRVVAAAREASCVEIHLEVARANRPAVAFYRAAGFVEIGVRKGYYRAPPDDALLFRLALAGPTGADDEQRR